MKEGERGNEGICFTCFTGLVSPFSGSDDKGGIFEVILASSVESVELEAKEVILLQSKYQIRQKWRIFEPSPFDSSFSLMAGNPTSPPAWLTSPTTSSSTMESPTSPSSPPPPNNQTPSERAAELRSVSLGVPLFFQIILYLKRD